MSPKYIEQVGKRLASERKRLGFKRQADFAKELGIPERTYWDREKGNIPPDAEFFAKFREIGGDVLFVIDGQQHNIEVKPYVGEPQADSYLPAAKLSRLIATLTLSEEDAEMLGSLAARLAKPLK